MRSPLSTFIAGALGSALLYTSLRLLFPDVSPWHTCFAVPLGVLGAALTRDAFS